MKKINREKKKTIICGDFNLNLLHFDTDKETHSFLSTMFQNSFQSCITEPTRITNSNKPSLVDNIFINTFDDPTCGNILEHISYDHLPNFIIMDHEHKTSAMVALVVGRAYGPININIKDGGNLEM